MRTSRGRLAILAGALLLAAPCARAPEPLSVRAAHTAEPARDAVLEAVRSRIAARARTLTPAEADELATAVVGASRSEDLPVELVLAMIEVESAYDPFAVSPVGALGLMQLLPATGAEMAARVGVRWRGTPTLFEPALNVRLGAAYLRQLVDRYASWRVALAAYNWGPGRIDARLRAGSTLPVRYTERVLSAYSGRRVES